MCRLIVLLFLWSSVHAQDSLVRDPAFVKIVEGLPSQEPFDSANSYRKISNHYIYIISDNDLHRVFDYETAMKFYLFDFSRYHILGRWVCPFCEAACNHEEVDKPCHRNVCEYEWTWEIRDNVKAFSEIPLNRFLGHKDAVYPTSFQHFFYDTVQLSVTDSSIHNWYTSGRGDCRSRFEYKVFRDRYYPAVILKESNYWGGCRAGGSWDFTISFPKQPGKLQYSKHTILVDKYLD